MVRAGIYARVSLDRDGTKESPETQVAECRGECRRRGWEVIDVYVDRDTSAFKPGVKRPQFDRMLRDVDARRIDVVVAVKLDRLTRGGITGLARILERLQAAGASMTCVHDSVDTTQGGLGELMLAALASFAKGESENTSRRVKSAAERAAREGRLPTGGSRQFGYYRDGSINQSEAEVVRSIFDWVLAGDSLRGIAARLNQTAVRTAQGKQWSSATVGQMIRSPRLAGIRIANGETVVGRWEPILSIEERTALLDALNRHPAIRRSTSRHLLTGLIVCGICGNPLKTMGWRMKNGKPFPRYQCVKQPGMPNCGGVAITKTSVDAHVMKLALDRLCDYLLLPIDHDATRIEHLEVELAMEKNSLNDLVQERFVRRAIDRDAYTRASDALNSRIEAIEEEIVALTNRHAALVPFRPTRGNRDDLESWWDQSSIEERRSVLRETIYRIIIHPAKHRGGNRFDPDRVEIKFNTWTLSARATKVEWALMSEDERTEALAESAEEAWMMAVLEAEQFTRRT
jgi:DNA invertase Pin-like site-specific DNA recombinase